MIIYLDAFYSSCDTNTSAVSVYFDKRKAFDSVPHIKLLSKLANFIFDSEFLHLIHSYLTNRSQCVKINQTLSYPLPVTSGVSQGSGLGTSLFLQFVDDIADNVENCSFYLFADNLKIFSTFLKSLVQDDINALLDWSNLNGLQFHPKNVRLSFVEAMMSLHNFCLGSNTCHLSIRSKIWVLLYPALHHGNLMLNQSFLNATEFSTSSNELFPSLCLVVENFFLTNPLSCLFYFTVPLPGLLLQLCYINSNCCTIKFFAG